MSKPVKGRGNPESNILLLGEKPGQEELKHGKAMIGRTGTEFSKILWKVGIKEDEVWIDNLLEDAPTGEDWSVTEADLQRNEGRIRELLDRGWNTIVTMGAVATKYLLGTEDTTGVRSDIYTVHAIPHTLADGTVVFPTVHPAAGFHDADAYPYIMSDFRLLAAYLNTGWTGPDRTDNHPNPKYTPLNNKDTSFIRHLFERRPVSHLALDTESNGFISFSGWEGEGYVIRPGQKDALMALARAITDRRMALVKHYAVHDIAELRRFGWDPVLARVPILDTMVAAYLLQIEPQGLKNLAYRHCGMIMQDYLDLVSPYSFERRLDWILTINEVDWGKPEPIITEKKNSTKITQPDGLNKRIAKTLKKLAEAGADGLDLWKWWNKIYKEVREPAELVFGEMPSANLDDVPFEEAFYYSCRDADATIRVMNRLVERLKPMELYDTWLMDCAIIPHIEEMQTVGFKADVAYFEALATAWRGEQGKIRKKLAEDHLNGRYINPESRDQVAPILYEEWGLPIFKETQGGLPSTSDKAIDWLKDRHPGVGLISRHREYDKAITSFCLPIIKYAKQASDHRIHHNIKYTRVVSGRLSDTDPNLLAMPVRSDLGKAVRQGFIAEDGHLLGSWDLNQIEMRFMAHESQDPSLIDAYSRGADIHKDTAADILGYKYEDVTSEQRDAAKRVGFGVITGITGAGLKDQFYLNGITKYDQDDCDKMILDYFRVRKGVKTYIEACRAEARRYGYVRESVGGRIRYLQSIQSTNKKLVAEAERASHSHKISSGAQAIIKIAMANAWTTIQDLREMDKVQIHWVLQVHDELILEFPEGYEVVLDPVVTDALCSTVKLRVPVKASGKWAKNWSKLK